jgi:hypothetical protein
MSGVTTVQLPLGSDNTIASEIPPVRQHPGPGAPRIAGPGYLARHPSKAKKVEYYKEQDRARSQRFYAARKQWRDAAKEYYGCQVCGERRPSALEFHHVDPETFAFTIAHINSGKAKLQEELGKCTVVCRNCHRVIHDTGALPALPLVNLDDLPPIP